MRDNKGLIFGVHPFGQAGMPEDIASGAPDDFDQIKRAITKLKGGAQNFVVRGYTHYHGAESAENVLKEIERLLQIEEQWDIVLSFRDENTELDGWLKLIRQIIGQYGAKLDTLQITGEANLLNMPGSGDGYYPNVRQALIQGIKTARKAIDELGVSTKTGFGVTPTFKPDNDFWDEIGATGGEDFTNALDYVGFDFYPDVFRQIELGKIPAAVKMILENFRHKELATSRIPGTVPIRITENGWATNFERPYELQARVLETVIRAIDDLREELNITHYELFGLRDADSANDNLFYQFGIMRDDYTPKPAFEIYKKLIRELS